MNYSASLAVSADLRTNANLLACAMGWDQMPGDTYSVPLSATGAEPATHYACHAWVTEAFVELLSEAAQGRPPAVDLEAVGLTPEDLVAVLAALLAHIRPGDEGVAFSGALAAWGLQRVAEPE